MNPFTFSPGKMMRFLPSMALNLWTKYSLKQSLIQQRKYFIIIYNNYTNYNSFNLNPKVKTEIVLNTE